MINHNYSHFYKQTPTKTDLVLLRLGGVHKINVFIIAGDGDLLHPPHQP